MNRPKRAPIGYLDDPESAMPQVAITLPMLLFLLNNSIWNGFHQFPKSGIPAHSSSFQIPHTRHVQILDTLRLAALQPSLL